ncbi:MAG: hypothetical protein AVDCRST_MAG56-7950 [uncultured Cytophagales bacterium]|uniref:Uncharacterized protein n=1 Tax=uncultured Cytophagales bacterium TaxID=158755 RepID=A0A6J4LUX5_9SPHI|nr:MAG: hypothetical protein AVDCRST_MAG56-7950 [uncultured Cytophagales bacterium]
MRRKYDFFNFQYLSGGLQQVPARTRILRLFAEIFFFTLPLVREEL